MVDRSIIAVVLVLLTAGAVVLNPQISEQLALAQATTAITIRLSPSLGEYSAGQTISISGTLTCSGLCPMAMVPYSDMDVVIASSWDWSKNVQTGSTGGYSQQVTLPNTAGSHWLEATFSGSGGVKGSSASVSFQVNSVAPPVQTKSTTAITVRLSLAKTAYSQGETVTVAGTLTCSGNCPFSMIPYSGMDVDVSGSWGWNGHAMTGTSGAYSLSIVLPSQAGSYSIKAEFDGSGNVQGSSASTSLIVKATIASASVKTISARSTITGSTATFPLTSITAHDITTTSSSAVGKQETKLLVQVKACDPSDASNWVCNTAPVPVVGASSQVITISVHQSLKVLVQVEDAQTFEVLQGLQYGDVNYYDSNDPLSPWMVNVGKEENVITASSQETGAHRVFFKFESFFHPEYAPSETSFLLEVQEREPCAAATSVLTELGTLTQKCAACPTIFVFWTGFAGGTVAWEKKHLEIKVVADRPDVYLPIVQEAAGRWQTAMDRFGSQYNFPEITGFTFTVSLTTSNPDIIVEFTDTHFCDDCIGFAQTTEKPMHIFIKTGKGAVLGGAGQTVTHELGHALGLAHAFDPTYYDAFNNPWITPWNMPNKIEMMDPSIGVDEKITTLDLYALGLLYHFSPSLAGCSTLDIPNNLYSYDITLPSSIPYEGYEQ